MSWTKEQLELRSRNLNAEATRFNINIKRRCYCPGDCNCRVAWRTNYCGCRCEDPTAEFINGHWETVR